MKKFALLLTVSAAFLVRTATAGTTIGINFVSDTNTYTASGVVSASAYPDALQTGDMAGAVPYAQTNWNNLGSQGSGSLGLVDSAGNPVTLVGNWDSGNSDSTGTAAGLGTPDGKLMDGFIYSWSPGSAPRDPLGNSAQNSQIGDKPVFYMRGLNSWYTSQGAEGFGIVAYITGYNNFELSEYWIESVSGDPLTSTMVSGSDLSPHYYTIDSSPYTGTYVQTTSTNINNPAFNANYAVLTGFTNDAVLIRVYCSSSYSSGLNGFQIIPIFPTQPTANTPTFAPSDTVFAGVPVTISEFASGDPFHPALSYQWMNDTNGGPVTNFLSHATNSTFSFTPTNAPAPYTMNFAVIVTNIFGGTTSTVATLTVNPAVPPFVTQDTTPGAGNGAAGVFAYVGSSITFSAAFGGTPSTFLWQSNSVNIPGATSLTLTIGNLQLADSANYQLTATNSVGGTNSTPSALTVLANPPAPTAAVPYAFDAFTNTPVAYWRFGETLDNVNNSVQAYDSSGHGFDATYGNGAADNQPGLQPSTYPGFESTNAAVALLNNVPNSFLISPSLNLNTNTVTITAWINPASGEVPFSGLLMWVNGTDKAGFGFGGNQNGAMAELGYTWDTNNPATVNFHSALYPLANQWSFVALTITPTSSTIYLYYIDGNTGITNLLKSTQAINNLVEPFSGGTTWIGSDTSAARNFNGSLDEVAVYNRALSEPQLQDLFLKGIGAASVAPTLFNATASPVTTVYSGQNVVITVTNVSATDPVNLQWQSSLDGSTWTNIPGANSATYVANPLVLGNRFYQLAAANAGGSAISSSVEATFTPLPVTPPGLWTVNFQVTNNVLNFATASTGVGGYVGRGVLGTGMHWNALPDLAGAFNTFSTITSVSDLADDGITHSGIYCSFVNGFGFSSATSDLPSADVNTLLDQYCTINFGPNALQLHGVPDGTYNLAIYACDGSFGDRGSTMVVHDVQNGDHTNSTVNASPIVPLNQGVNFALFSNVHASGGTLSIDVLPNTPLPTHATNGEADLNAIQIQLVSYDVNPAPVFLTGTNNGSNLSLNWPQGLLETSTNILGPWSQIIAPAPTSVPITNGTHYFRVQVH